MNTVLAFARGFLTAEKHSGDGRPDFVLETRRQVLVIEIKYAKSDDPCVNSTLDNPSGVKQADIIHDDSGDTRSANPSVTTLPGVSLQQNDQQKWEEKTQIRSLIDSGITAALNQISDKNYASEYLDGSKRVWAVAVSILGRTAVKIQFAEISRK